MQPTIQTSSGITKPAKFSALISQELSSRNIKAPRVLDLFCGCGGLSYGFMKSGYNVVLGIDNWKESLDTFLYNHKGAKACQADISKISPNEISERYGIDSNEIDVIIGGPPCQGFSIAGKRESNDPRNLLYKGFVSFVDYFKPKAFVMENVPNLVSMDGGVIKDKIISDFEKIGYRVTYQVLKSSDYGVPQHRRRVFFVGLKDGNEFQFPEKTHGTEHAKQVSSLEAISDLPESSVEDGIKHIDSANSEYQMLMRKDAKGIYNHEITNHAEKTTSIISLVPDGGNYKDLPTELQGTRKVNIAWTRIRSWEPSFTIDTGHRHHFHYKYNRVPTVRESARIQSFDDSFFFRGSKTSQYKQVGNAVPPLLAKAVADSLLSFI